MEITNVASIAQSVQVGPISTPQVNYFHVMEKRIKPALSVLTQNVQAVRYFKG